MAENNENKKKFLVVGTACLIFIFLLVSAAFVLKGLMGKDDGKRRRQIQRVTLVKPPPPPKIKEQPPEPEIKKKEEIVEPEPEEQPEDDMDDAMEDDGPTGEELGLDADGTGAGDSFGLAAKKGYRSLIGGSGGSKSLMRRYAWYTRILQDEVREKVNKYLEDKKDIPSGKHKMFIWVRLDEKGNLQLESISKSSGNVLVDTAVEQAISGFRVSEAPPGEMPKKIKVKVTFKS